jgi:D-inositol-3-phosphate glycosyltransferase
MILMKKLHILFVLDYYTPHRWGAETVFDHITKNLLARWYHITVLTSHYLPSLPVFESMQGIDVHRVWNSRLFFVFSAVWRGIQLCRDKNIDFVHSSTYGGAIPAWFIAFFTKKKVVLTVHEVFGSLWSVYKWFYKAGFYRFFEWLIFVFPYTVYHVVSQYTLNSIRSLYSISDRKIRLVYNGVDSDFWSPAKVSKKSIIRWRKKYGRGSRFVLLYYGHSGKSKWLDYLIDALPDIFSLYPNMLFVCNLIHAKRDKETKQRLRQLWYSKNIQVFSWFSLESLRVLVSASDCVVAPSLSEGFGSVHAEVSSLGKPLITTHVASIPEVVHWQVVFVQSQSASAIVDGVRSVMDRRWIFIDQKLFPWKGTIDGIEQLYRDFIL